MMKKHVDSPVAFIGIATQGSQGDASQIPSRHKVSFPTGVDLGGLTYALYGVDGVDSYGFLIDEQGKIEYGYELGWTVRSTGEEVFVTQAEKLIENAKDPFGITDVPDQCKSAYEALKYGQYALAKGLASRLRKSSDSQVKSVANAIVAAADKTEADWLARIEKLAADGDAGNLYEETRAYLESFPGSKSKSSLSNLKRSVKSQSKSEAMASANFERVLSTFKSSKTAAINLARMIAQQFGDTYHGAIAQKLLKANGQK